MTPYEAERATEEYKIRIPGFGKLANASFRQHAATVIDTDWKSSWYWDKPDKPWWEIAIQDCKNRIAGCQEELKELQSVLEKLESIEA